MPVLGVPPHPQVLFAGYEKDDPDYLAMAELVPSHRLMPEDGVRALRAVEWDVVVCRGGEVDYPGFMHVLAMACASAGVARTAEGWKAASYNGVQPSDVLIVADDLPDALRRLVNADVIPWLQQQPSRPYLTTYTGNYGGTARFRAQPAAYRMPFVTEVDGAMIAGAFERQDGFGGGGWCWTLPFVPPQPHLWLAAALEDWHDRTPDRVPRLPGWRSRPQWRSRPEVAAMTALELRRRAHEEEQQRFEQEERDLLAASATATAHADAGERRMLTAQGAPLVEAVTAALRGLGFRVIDVDEDLTQGQAKVEDLRVVDPAHAAWTNITEVKGYTGGAKSSDFQKLGRFATLYAARTSKAPASQWYVVNHSLDADPDTRRAALLGSEEDVDVFADGGGLVIDTRDLFRLQRLVEDGTMSAEVARDCLRGRRGVLRQEDYDPDRASGAE